MQQLPVSFFELIALHLYLSSVTNIVGMVGFGLILKKLKRFTWKRYLITMMVILLIGNSFAFMIWVIWPFSFDIMLGPMHLPTLASWLFMGVLVIRYYLQWAIQNDW